MPGASGARLHSSLGTSGFDVFLYRYLCHPCSIPSRRQSNELEALRQLSGSRRSGSEAHQMKLTVSSNKGSNGWRSATLNKNRSAERGRLHTRDATYNGNVRGTLFMLQKALAFLRDHASIILNGAAGSGGRGFPTITVCAASKAALRSIRAHVDLSFAGSQDP